MADRPSRDWNREPYRKLFLRPSSDFLTLPVLVQGLAYVLVRIADEDGRIRVDADFDKAVTLLCRRLGTHPRERPLINGRIAALIEDGFLSHAGDYFVVKNLATMNARKGDSHNREINHLGRSRRESHESSTGVPREYDESVTGVGGGVIAPNSGDAHDESDVTTRNHSPESAMKVGSKEGIEGRGEAREKPLLAPPEPRTFERAPHGGKTAEEKAYDVDMVLWAIGEEGRQLLGVTDEQGLRRWVARKLDSADIPSGVCVAPLVRFAIAELRNEDLANPGLPKQKRIGTFERQLGFKLTDDAADGWAFCRSNGASGKLAIKPIGRGATRAANENVPVDMGAEEIRIRELQSARAAAPADPPPVKRPPKILAAVNAAIAAAEAQKESA